ncbi:MAG: hypothetical protein V3U75_08720 [Methylococcaceae bacterium]
MSTTVDANSFSATAPMVPTQERGTDEVSCRSDFMHVPYKERINRL